MQQRPVIEFLARPGEQAPQPDAEHRKAKPDHDPERPEDDAHRRFVLVGNRIKPGQWRIEIMFEDQRRCLGYFNGIIDPLFLAVGNAEQDQRRTIGMAVKMAFHGHYLCRLML